MKFTSPQAIEQVVWEMRLSDFPRGLNRSKINSVFNGVAPYTPDEVRVNKRAVNVNFLEGTNIAHDARRQFATAFLNPDPLFTVDVDYGPIWQRQKWSNRITKEINKIIKGSAGYQETRRSVFALDVLHGIGPAVWQDKYRWCPRCRGIEDVLIPSNTLLDMENLPMFAVFEQYTAFQLSKATSGPHVDPAWNMPLVKACIAWVDEQAKTLMSSSWPEIWSPEKMEERIKQDGGLFASDAIPTIDTWHFYFWDDSEGRAGWRKRVVLDAWGDPGAGGMGGITPTKVSGKYGLSKDIGGLLYDSGKRVYADKLSQIIHFQFADASAVAPFRYHSVRSLGFLLYSVCHLQNRLRCQFTEAVFESLMQYFRVNNLPDAERALRIDLTDKTPLPDGLTFVSPQERWKIDKQIVEMCLAQNRSLMDDNASSYTQDFDSDRGQYETATRTMAKVNSSAALVSAMLTQAYNYQKFQYDEIARRFCVKNSKDADVRLFRKNCLASGIPEEVLNVAMWNVQPVRVIGSGNKMLQSAMMDKIMTVYYNKLDPSAQQEAKRMGIAITTDDYDLAQRWVPDQPHVSDSVHDAQLAAGVMFAGLPVALKEGVNHLEYAQALMVSMNAKIQEIMGRGGMATPQEIAGLQAMAGQTVQGQSIPGNGILAHILLLAEDEKQPHVKGQQQDHTVRQQVKELSDHLKNLMNEVRGLAQRAAEAAKQQQGQQGMDPQAQAKVASAVITAKTKAQLSAQSHAARTAQRQIQFEQQLQQDAQKHQLEMAKAADEHQMERMRAFSDGEKQ